MYTLKRDKGGKKPLWEGDPIYVAPDPNAGGLRFSTDFVPVRRQGNLPWGSQYGSSGAVDDFSAHIDYGSTLLHTFLAALLVALSLFYFSSPHGSKPRSQLSLNIVVALTVIFLLALTAMDVRTALQPSSLSSSNGIEYHNSTINLAADSRIRVIQRLQVIGQGVALGSSALLTQVYLLRSSCKRFGIYPCVKRAGKVILTLVVIFFTMSSSVAAVLVVIESILVAARMDVTKGAQVFGASGLIIFLVINASVTISACLSAVLRRSAAREQREWAGQHSRDCGHCTHRALFFLGDSALLCTTLSVASAVMARLDASEAAQSCQPYVYLISLLLAMIKSTTNSDGPQHGLARQGEGSMDPLRADASLNSSTSTSTFVTRFDNRPPLLRAGMVSKSGLNADQRGRRFLPSEVVSTWIPPSEWEVSVTKMNSADKADHSSQQFHAGCLGLDTVMATSKSWESTPSMSDAPTTPMTSPRQLAEIDLPGVLHSLRPATALSMASQGTRSTSHGMENDVATHRSPSRGSPTSEPESPPSSLPFSPSAKVITMDHLQRRVSRKAVPSIQATDSTQHVSLHEGADLPPPQVSCA